MTGLKGKRILVVEDEPVVAMMVEDMLEELGAETVGPAATVARAIALIEQGGLDAALLDVNLQGERSHDIADRLRRQGVPYLFATGYGEGHDRHDGADVIEKPYRRDQIATALIKLVEGR